MPRTLRIQGLVALADHLRQALAKPLDAAQIARPREQTNDALAVVANALAAERATATALPAPTRRAYAFLRDLDFAKLEPAAADAAPAEHLRQLRFPGLQQRFQTLLARLAVEENPCTLHAPIQHESAAIEAAITNHGVGAEQLSARTRAVRGWLAWFSDCDCLSDYAAARDRAATAFIDNAGQRWRSTVRVHLRPMTGIVRVRQSRSELLVELPTPMVCFDAALFTQVAGFALRRQRQRQAIMAAMSDEPYQTLQAELEALGGIVENSAGLCHDLCAAFARVNQRYFAGAMHRLRLCWSRSFTGRKLGHYDPVRDTVMISATLDHADVPAFAVDFVLYHELLHKKHGLDWRRGRAHVHTPTFRRDEQQFHGYTEAEQWLIRATRMT